MFWCQVVADDLDRLALFHTDNGTLAHRIALKGSDLYRMYWSYPYDYTRKTWPTYICILY